MSTLDDWRADARNWSDAYPDDTDNPAAIQARRVLVLLDAVPRYADLVRRATNDPGAFTPRGRGNDGEPYGESLSRWQDRAIDVAIMQALTPPSRPDLSVVRSGS